MDYYLENSDRLKGQPKRTIADYVESNGILVPRKFDSLTEARKSHKRILLRSEHVQEYDGVSGLLDSFELSGFRFNPRGSEDLNEIKKRYFDYAKNGRGAFAGGTPMYEQYCNFLGIDKEKFKDEISFSFWESLDGVNRTIVADSTIPNRYHIMSFRYEKGNSIMNYSIVEKGKQTQEFVKPLPNELKKDLPRLIETYEQVRNLERFDFNHCPIMEFQTSNGKNYFLQYHRVRDFSPANFILERETKKGEVEVPFVRGATLEEGMDCKITVYYNNSGNWKFKTENEDGSFDLHWNWVFPELQFRKRKLQVISEERLDWELMGLVVKHSQRSKMFKPEVSAIIPIELLIKDNEVICGGNKNISYNGQKYVPRDPILKEGEKIFNFFKESTKGHNSYMNLHIVSDGRRAIIQRI